MPPLDALTEAVGAAYCLRDADTLAAHAQDWRGVPHGAPVAVLRPGTTAEVAAVVREAAAAGLAVVPAGGRTGLAGGAAVRPDTPSVLLSLERLNRIRDLDARDFSIVAEAGCVVQTIQEAAAAAGRLFPISWGAQGSAQIGGMLSTNAGGIRTLRWGNARELVLGLEVVLPDGRVLNDLRRVRKDNSGYALRHLFIGAEGTLGVITAAALRLVPALKRVETAFVAVPSPDAALTLFGRVMEAGADVIAFELLRGLCLEISVRQDARVRAPLPVGAPWYVMVELAAAHPSVPLREILEDVLAAAMEADECLDATLAESEAQRTAFWYIRETWPEHARAEAPAISTDTSVPVSAVPAFLAEAERVLASGWPEGRMVAIGHLGDGNIHLGLMAPPGVARADWYERAAGAEAAVNAVAVGLGGSFSAEHGIGLYKRHAMATHKDPLAMELMRAVKATLDPGGVMNPGKVLPGN